MLPIHAAAFGSTISTVNLRPTENKLISYPIIMIIVLIIPLAFTKRHEINETMKSMIYFNCRVKAGKSKNSPTERSNQNTHNSIYRPTEPPVSTWIPWARMCAAYIDSTGVQPSVRLTIWNTWPMVAEACVCLKISAPLRPFSSHVSCILLWLFKWK